MALSDSRLHQTLTRIGDQRGAGVADQGDRAALLKVTQNVTFGLIGVVFAVGVQRAGERVQREKLGRYACVFGENGVCRPQNMKRAQCYVAGIADGRGHQVEAWGQSAV